MNAFGRGSLPGLQRRIARRKPDRPRRTTSAQRHPDAGASRSAWPDSQRAAAVSAALQAARSGRQGHRRERRRRSSRRESVADERQDVEFTRHRTIRTGTLECVKQPLGFRTEHHGGKPAAPVRRHDDQPGATCSAAARMPRKTSADSCSDVEHSAPALRAISPRARQAGAGLGADGRLVVRAGNRARFAHRAIRIGRCHRHRGQSRARRFVPDSLQFPRPAPTKASHRLRRGLCR